MTIRNLVKTTNIQTDTSLITVIPTTLIRLNWKQAAHVLDTLTCKRWPNPFVDSAQFDSIDVNWFWIDLVQLVREAPDIAEDLKGQGCAVYAGCRVNTRAEHWLQWFSRELKDGAYERGGTSWINLHYAVVATKAKRVYADIVSRGYKAPTCVRQGELPISSLHAVPPDATWMKGSTLLPKFGEKRERKSVI